MSLQGNRQGLPPQERGDNERVQAQKDGVPQTGEFVMSQAASMSFEPQFEVRFRSLLRRGYALVFPCDRDGHVDLDDLSDRTRADYLFARAMIGREFSLPAVCPHESPHR
jgi:hypothetical protein